MQWVWVVTQSVHVPPVMPQAVSELPWTHCEGTVPGGVQHPPLQVPEHVFEQVDVLGLQAE